MYSGRDPARAALRSSLEPSAGTAGSSWRLPPRQSFLSGKLLPLWSTARYPMVQGRGECQLQLYKALKGESLRLKLEETIPVAHNKRLKKKQGV